MVQISLLIKRCECRVEDDAYTEGVGLLSAVENEIEKSTCYKSWVEASGVEPNHEALVLLYCSSPKCVYGD